MTVCLDPQDFDIENDDLRTIHAMITLLFGDIVLCILWYSVTGG